MVTLISLPVIIMHFLAAVDHETNIQHKYLDSKAYITYQCKD